MVQSEDIVQTIKVTKAEKTQKRCLEAAIAILSQNGLADLTYEAIAKRAGVTRPLVKNYFPSFAELIHQAAQISLNEFQTKLVEEMNLAQTPEKKFAAYLKSMLGWVRNFPEESGFWLCFYQYSHVDKKCRETNTAIGIMGQKRIAALISACAFEPSRSPDEIDTAAKNIQLVITGAVINMLTENVAGGLGKFEKKVADYCFDILEKMGAKGFRA